MEADAGIERDAEFERETRQDGLAGGLAPLVEPALKERLLADDRGLSRGRGIDHRDRLGRARTADVAVLVDHVDAVRVRADAQRARHLDLVAPGAICLSRVLNGPARVQKLHGCTGQRCARQVGARHVRCFTAGAAIAVGGQERRVLGVAGAATIVNVNGLLGGLEPLALLTTTVNG